MKKRPLREILAGNLRQLMDAHEHLNTQMRLASRSGVAQRTVGRMLKAEVDPQLGHVQAVAEALGVSVTSLLTDQRGDNERELKFDRIGVEELAPEDRAKIEAFIQFILSTRSDKAKSAPLSISETIAPSAEQAAAVRHVAQRQLSDQTLSVNEEQKEKPTRTKRRHS